MKIIVFVVLAFVASTIGAEICTIGATATKEELDWINMQENCITATRNQIQMEFDASYSYLELGAYFSRYSVNRPGFAEFFFKAAKEEREHGIHLIEYLSMRGKLDIDAKKEGNQVKQASLFNVPTIPTKNSMKYSGIQALTAALKLETEVTNSIRNLIKVCNITPEKKDQLGNALPDQHEDYHFVDYLTGVYLEEQYKGQRDIAGKLGVLKKMSKANGQDLAEFLFDKEL